MTYSAGPAGPARVRGVTRESVLSALAMILIAVVWTVHPGAALVLIGGSIGLLTITVWVARKLGI